MDQPTDAELAAPPRTVQAGAARGSAGHEPVLRLEGAGRTYGAVRALSGVDLTVAPGERVAIIGPSGAGKSTLLRLAGGAHFAGEGRVTLFGDDPARLAPGPLRRLRARVGTVYQQLQLVPQASVLENVLMGRLGRLGLLHVALGPYRRAVREEVAGVLARVGLSGRLHERFDRLSGGEQQRVAVARVLWQAPDLLLADEPFSAIDPERSAGVLRLLVEAAAGRTLLLSTHQLAPVLPHFPRLVGLRQGRLLFDKPREAVTPADLARLYQAEAPAPEPR
jgi:phosphonate transport system ATP-binding protein